MSLPVLGDLVYVERKTNRINNNTPNGMKERISLPPEFVYSFIKGKYVLDDFIGYLESQGHDEDTINIACRLFAEFQSEIIQRNFQAVLTTSFNRTAFHNTNEQLVILVDTNIQLIRESLSPYPPPHWKKPDMQIAEEDIHEFPYATLEIKLPLQRLHFSLLLTSSFFALFPHCTHILKFFPLSLFLLPVSWPENSLVRISYS